jgi:hypothetical protein
MAWNFAETALKGFVTKYGISLNFYHRLKSIEEAREGHKNNEVLRILLCRIGTKDKLNSEVEFG